MGVITTLWRTLTWRILQARTLEWVAISFSNAWKWKVKGKLLSRIRLLATPWTAAYQAPSFIGFSRQEYWSGVPLPSLHRHCRATNLCSIKLLGLPWWLSGKESACNAGDWGSILGQEDPLEKEMATLSSILAWRISWTEDTGGLQCMGLPRAGHDLMTKPPPRSSC